MGYLDQAASLPALRAAVDVAARNRGAPGPDGVTVAAFAALGDAELSRLQEELLSGAYRPRPARRVPIPKPGGGYRNLSIGCVRDRVVQHALAATLSAALDGHLHPFAYAYRRGRSTRESAARRPARRIGGYNVARKRREASRGSDRLTLVHAQRRVTPHPLQRRH